MATDIIARGMAANAGGGGGGDYPPSSGIPKSDLSAAVQASLGRADTALQAVPNTYRTAAAQDVIDAGKEAAANKVTSISASSTDTQYPSAKAVYSFIQSLDGNGVSY